MKILSIEHIGIAVEDIEDSYLEEAEFLHKYESGDIWGIA